VSEPPRANLTPPALAADRAAAPIAPRPKRSRAAAIALLVALPILGMFTLWSFKHRLIEASGGSAAVTPEAVPVSPGQTVAPASPGANIEPGKGSAPAAPAADLDAGVDASPSPK
jgi:hypothetical protein